MVERIFHRDEKTEENIIPKAKGCSYCGGEFNKGVEIVVTGAISGYKGTYCCQECKLEGLKKYEEKKDSVG